MAKFCAILVFGLLAAVLSQQPDAFDDVALAQGDECHALGVDSADCALNALQRSGQKIEASKAGDSAEAEESGIISMEIPPSEPDAKMYSNITLQDLGMDELQQLVEAARGVMDGRLAGSAAEPSPADADPDAEASEIPEANEAAAVAATGCPFRQYTGGMSGSNLCFCQLAGNSGCSHTGCACPQGCGSGVIWPNAESVTFKNMARAEGCSPSTVLLTASRSYYSTTRELRDLCTGGAASLVEAMLRNSWDHYQSKVGKGPVNQCFHSPRIATVKYLHLQTFCADGEFHAMPTGNRKNGIGFCVTMSSIGEAGSLASKLAAWL